ncbi:hypothetical protein PPGU16_83400 (plasmid) [Paraburkholderia largidicola]|uniref:Lipoprotein n=1 Tax=Paraburkholderia largidicola TaxID=3014751 RepID=A0A7I8C366_9BURK|nr:hypothetical protein PPGU16_83400 [Paraburkholderia sp. PGU16]
MQKRLGFALGALCGIIAVQPASAETLYQNSRDVDGPTGRMAGTLLFYDIPSAKPGCDGSVAVSVIAYRDGAHVHVGCWKKDSRGITLTYKDEGTNVHIPASEVRILEVTRK